MNGSTYISNKAKIGKGVLIGNNVQIFGEVNIDDHTIIENNVMIGHPSPEELRRPHDKTSLEEYYESVINSATNIGSQSVIRSNTVIYSGCKIGNAFDCGHNTLIRENCSIDNNVYIKQFTQILKEVEIGKNCRLTGVIADRTKIGNYVSSFGILTHNYQSLRGGFIESAPILEDYVVVGRNSSIIGGIILGKGCFIAAGSVVRKNIPEFALVYGEKCKILQKKSPVYKMLKK